MRQGSGQPEGEGVGTLAAVGRRPQSRPSCRLTITRAIRWAKGLPASAARRLALAIDRMAKPAAPRSTAAGMPVSGCTLPTARNARTMLVACRATHDASEHLLLGELTSA